MRQSSLQVTSESTGGSQREHRFGAAECHHGVGECPVHEIALHTVGWPWHPRAGNWRRRVASSLGIQSYDQRPRIQFIIHVQGWATKASELKANGMRGCRMPFFLALPTRSSMYSRAGTVGVDPLANWSALRSC